VAESPIALSSSRNSAPVRVGKVGVECAITSVWTRRPSLLFGSWKRRPKPWGRDGGAVSGIAGRPVEVEKRARRGVDGRLKWGAELSLAASLVGVKVPVRRLPFA
jgi:hypothetical protein